MAPMLVQNLSKLGPKTIVQISADSAKVKVTPFL
jgi:hypothetical protein